MKFSEMPAATAFDGSEIVAVSQMQSGTLTSARTTITSIISYLRGLTGLWTKNQTVTPTALTYAATVTPDASTSNNFKLTLTGNVTIANPTNLGDGMVLNLIIKQDGTGGHTITLGSKFKWPGGTVPTWVTTANAINFVSCYYDSAADVLVSNGGAGYA